MKRRRRAASSTYLCPHCGEQVDTWPDIGGGEQQEYIEDCPVCCRPNRIQASYSLEDRGYWISASPDV
jgi:hypothetical protein